MGKYKARYYRAPSFAKLVNLLQLTRDQAIKVRRIIHGTLDPASVPQTQRWINQCFKRPYDIELRMHAINGIIEGHGIEAIENRDSGYLPSAEYVNMGDSYDATILYCYDSKTFKLISWADYVEKLEQCGLSLE